MVCFHFVSSFSTVMSVPILNCLHACRKQGKILLYHLIQLRPWSTRKAKIAFPLLLTSNFSPKSREKPLCRAAGLLSSVSPWPEGTWQAWDEEDFYFCPLFLMSLCTLLPCKRSHTALQRAPDQLFPSQMLWEYRRSTRTAGACLNPATGWSAGLQQKSQVRRSWMKVLDVSKGLAQDIPCSVEKRGCFARCDFGDNIKAGLQQP